MQHPQQQGQPQQQTMYSMNQQQSTQPKPVIQSHPLANTPMQQMNQPMNQPSMYLSFCFEMIIMLTSKITYLALLNAREQ